MPDRVASDHPTIGTVRATVARRGGTRRSVIEIPASAGDDVEPGIARLVIDGDECRAPIRADPDGGFVIDGGYANARQARERSGPDRLAGWLQDQERPPGRTVAFDVVIPRFRYGVRLPSERVVYDTTEPPTAGLRDIADRLDGA